MISPCIKICTIDPASKLCVGCFRTLDEIGQWAQLPVDEQRRIMTLLARRGTEAGLEPIPHDPPPTLRRRAR